MSDAHALRLVPVFPASALGEDVLARGGRCFTVRHSGAGADGELLVTVPEVGGRQVLVPRGFGRPLLARPAPGGWAVEGSGQPCSPLRWLAAGGLAARVRPYSLPVGPAVAAPPLRRGPEGAGPWLALRPVTPWLEAACRSHAGLRRGPVAIVAGRVCEVSAAAAAAGVAPGMSPRLARRRCPELRLVERPALDLAAQLRALLEVEVGPVVVQRGALLVHPAGERPAELLQWAERLALRVWQQLGVRLRMTFSADPVVAARFTRLLDADTLAWVPASASACWRRRRAAQRRAGWRGQVADVEGIVALARAVAARAEGEGRLLVQTAGARFEVRCAAAGAPAAVEAALRARAVHLGELRGLDWVAAPPRPSLQLSLLGRAHGG